MVFLWKIPDDYPEELIGEYDRTLSPDRFLLKKGQLLASDIGRCHFRFLATRKELESYDDLANNAMVPLVSQRLGKRLQEICLAEIQLIEAEVLAADGRLDGYSVLNALNAVEGLDHAESIYSKVPGTDRIMRFKKLRYRPDCLGRLSLARDVEYLSNLLVSESLRDAVVAGRYRGVGLYSPEEVA